MADFGIFKGFSQKTFEGQKPVNVGKIGSVTIPSGVNPIALEATGVGQTSFTANWEAFTGAVVYLLDVSTSATFDTFIYENQQVNAPTTSYVVIGLTPNTTYYYRVRASTEALTDPDYQAVLDYATTQGYTLPSASQQALQNQLVVDLKDAGIWSKLDIFYVFATDGDSDFATINWANPNSFQCSKVNSPGFTSNVGFNSNGTSSYLNTNWNPSSNASNFQLLSNSLHYAVRNVGEAHNGARDANDGNQITYTTFVQRHQGTAADFAQTITISQNSFWSSIRNNTSTAQYVNSTLTRTITNTPSTLPNLNYYICAFNNGGTPFISQSAQISFLALGDQISNSTMYNAWTTYFNAI